MDSTNFGGLMLLIIAAILAILFLLWAAWKPASNNPSASEPKKIWGKKDASPAEDISIAPHRLDRLRQVRDQCKAAPTSYGNDRYPPDRHPPTE